MSILTGPTHRRYVAAWWARLHASREQLVDQEQRAREVLARAEKVRLENHLSGRVSAALKLKEAR